MVMSQMLVDERRAFIEHTHNLAPSQLSFPLFVQITSLLIIRSLPYQLHTYCTVNYTEMTDISKQGDRTHGDKDSPIGLQ
jgi:hypothetical protein